MSLQLVLADDVTTLVTAPAIYDITKNSWSVFTVTADGPLISASINGIPAFTVYDNTLSSGSVGLYAESQASFDDFVMSVPCVACEGASEGETCTLTPFPGVGVVGNTTMTCSGGVWAPPLPPVFTLPVPVLAPMMLSVPEYSPVNTPVGPPLEAVGPVPDLQIGYEIVANGTNTGAFWVDQCGGQVRVRNPMLDASVAPVYVLTIRAFIIDYPTVASNVSVTIVLTPGARPLSAPPVQALSIPEHSPGGAPVGLVVISSPWTPGSVAFRMVNDGSRGRMVVNALTGLVSVASPLPAALPLEFENAADNAWSLTIEFHPIAFPTASTTVNVRVSLSDVNDAPALPLGYTLRLNDTLPAGAPPLTLAPPLSSATVDPDASVPGSPFLVPPRFVAVPFSSYNASCGFNTTGDFWPTTNGYANGTALFTVDANSGAVSLVALPLLPWTARPSFAFFNAPTRAVYPLCVVVSDTAGAVSPGALIFIAVSAGAVSTAGAPVVVGLSPVTLLPTGGGTVLTFSTSSSSLAMVPGAAITASYTNTQWFPFLPAVPRPTSYNASSCAVLTPTSFSCVTVPGIGASHRWSFFYASISGAPATQMATSDVITSYALPNVSSVVVNVLLGAPRGEECVCVRVRIYVCVRVFPFRCENVCACACLPYGW